MNRIFFYIFLIVISFSCNSKKIVQPSDYNIFLSDNNKNKKATEKINTELDFWNKRLESDTGSFVNMLEMASNHIKLFNATGKADHLHIADSFYLRVISKVKDTEPEIYFSIAQNAITQHRFQDSWKYLQRADSIGVNPFIIKLLKFDAAMEIGLYEQAFNNLEAVKNENSFDYLIRKAKWEDHNGNLDKAIQYMEKALTEAEFSGKESMILWAKSNLADMYGHAGRVNEAYKNYLDILKIDSNYLYALKGLAWIAFSHDKNTKEAKRILQYILSQTSEPDLYLTLAEIAEWENNPDERMRNIEKFLSIVEDSAYGDMYNKYLIQLFAEDPKNYDKAFAIAKKEVENRPTAETYSWLAWVYFKIGEHSKAYELAKNFVLGKSFEPDLQLHVAYILKANGESETANKILNECLGSSFELGPVETDSIKKLL